MMQSIELNRTQWDGKCILSPFDFASFSKASARIRSRSNTGRLNKAQAVEVHAAVARHQARQTNRPLVEPPAGRVLAIQTEKRNSFAIAVGEGFHARIRSLYTSKRAAVAYGVGGQECVDYDAYAKSYGYPAQWKDAGARIEGESGAACVVLETSRGTEVARVPFDPRQIGKINPAHQGLIDGDLWGVERHAGVAERYALKRGKVVRVGFSVQFPIVHAWQGGTHYWEHGGTIEKCRAEHQHKLDVEAKKAQEQAVSRKVARAARLIARYVCKIPVNYADARAVGHCDQGIRGWCAKHQIDPDGQIDLATLRREATDSAAQRVLLHVARQCAERMVAAHQ